MRRPAVAACVIGLLMTTIGTIAPPAAGDSNDSPGGPSFATITAGAYHSCAITEEGAVKCWGRNSSGQLGLGDTAFRGDGPGEMAGNLPSVDLGTGRTATSISAGAFHTCAILDDGAVKCWGAGGQLGLGATGARGDGPGEMGDALPAVDLGTGRTANAISAGGVYTCAILDNGSVKCWGRNAGGQLGLGDTLSRGAAAGQMGDALPAVDLGTGRTAVAIATSSMTSWGIDFTPNRAHTCALLDNGSIKCWGRNTGGQLGLGDTANRGDGPGEMGDALPAVLLGSGRTATAVSVGWGHACALLDDGSVKCWGFSFRGQLGLGTTNTRGDGPGEMGDALPAVDLGTGAVATGIAVGDEHGCALLEGGSVKCWGENDRGQLGLGNTANRGDGPGEMGDALPAISLGAGRSVTALAADGSTTTGDGDTRLHDGAHTCARLDNGDVKCWGTNSSGELGQGDTVPRGDQPGEMGDALLRINLGEGLWFEVELTSDERAVTAGDDIHYHLTISNPQAVTLTGLVVDDPLAPDCEQPVPDLAPAASFTIDCSRATDVSEFGPVVNQAVVDSDQSEPMQSNQVKVHVDRAHPRTALAVDNGRDHACAVLDDGQVKCWGSGANGALGYGDTSHRGDQQGEMGDDLPAVDLGTGRTAAAISAGTGHTCALLDGGAVKCWGLNHRGQLGQGHPLDRGDQPGEMGDDLPPVDLGTGRTATAITTGRSFTCALLDDGTIKCWGDGASGQLGQGDTAHLGNNAGEMGENLPAIDLGTGRTATAVTAGLDHVCAILDDASLKCWGHGLNGKLGLGDTSTRGNQPGEMGANLPTVDLGAGHTATAVAADEAHTCAVLDDGAVKCWGEGSGGRRGSGDTTDRGDGPGEMGDSLAEVDLGTGRSATAITAGFNHSCAILDDSSVRCWGSNENGSLGLGDTAPRGDQPGEMGSNLAPVDLGTNRTATAIAAGAATTCALLDRGSVKCWGAAHLGQLGLWDTAARGDGPDEMGDDLPTVDLGTEPAPGAVAGTVTESGSGDPIGGAIVAVLDAVDFSPGAVVQADAAGAFTATAPAGSYLVYSIDPAGGHQPGFHGNPTSVAVTIGGSVTADVALASTRGAISGTVADADGAVEGALAITVDLRTGQPAEGALTDATGQYRIEGLAAGNRLVQFVDPTGGHTPEFYDDAAEPGAAALVPVTTAATTTADATLATQPALGSSAHLVGDVTATTGGSLAGVAVLAVRAGDFSLATGTLTDANGHYDIALDPGTYKLAFYDPAADHSFEWHADQPAQNLAGASTVTATDGSPLDTDAALTPTTGAISGTVTSTDGGAPLQGVVAVAIATSGTVVGAATSAADGAYTLTALPPGSVRVRYLDGTGQFLSEYFANSPGYDGANLVAVTAGATTSSISVALAPID